MGLNTLDCAFGQPPQHSMPIIIECAILGSPHQKLTLSELRLTLKRRFRHYEKEEEKGIKSWEVSLATVSNHFGFFPCRHFVFHLSEVDSLYTIPRSIMCLLCCTHSTISPTFPLIALDRSFPVAIYVLLTLDPCQRTLLQNLSKKSRFINTERSLSEPGQGGYWRVNHNAPPPSRARKRTSKRLVSPLRSTSMSPVSQAEQDPSVSSTLGSSSSLFPSVPAELLPGGRASGMNECCILLPGIPRRETVILPSSPRRWSFSRASTFARPFEEHDSITTSSVRVTNYNDAQVNQFHANIARTRGVKQQERL